MEQVRFIETFRHVVDGHDVLVGMDANEQFYAIHQQSPYFCLPAGSERGALNAAERAFASYERMERRVRKEP